MVGLRGRRRMVAMGIGLSLLLGLLTVTGVSSTVWERVQAASPSGVTAATLGDAGLADPQLAVSRAAVAAPAAAPASLSLEETRAQWYEQMYAGRIFLADDSPARHPEP
jgi:hypothetical protein